MTAFDYTVTRATADRLLTRFGQTVALRRLVASGPAAEPTQTPTDYATVAALFDYTAAQIDDESILATDRRAYVAAGPLTALGISSIAPPDHLVVGGVAVPIVAVRRLDPAAVVVLWDCQLRL